MVAATINADVVIFGGGAAGLWLLDDLHRAGYHVILLEKHALGSGQTIASQGIIHGGLKYTLSGKLTRSADAIKSLPTHWRQCLAGEATPNLSATPMRSPHCYLWSTESLKSKLGMFGASHALTVKPNSLAAADWPTALQGVRGSVMQLDEQVISPQGFIAALAEQHRDRLIKVGDETNVAFESSDGLVQGITLCDEKQGHALRLNATNIVFAAGEGNETLRESVGLPGEAMQRRPVQMILARGNLPSLNGHCVDGRRTRVTITSEIDSQGRTIWQVGGQVSEDGVTMTRESLVTHTKHELQSCIPGIDLTGVEWTTYSINKAEGVQKGGRRPANEIVLHEGNIVTVWPTKLVLAPLASKRVMALLPPPMLDVGEHEWESQIEQLKHWPRPDVATPPWETAEQWISEP